MSRPIDGRESRTSTGIAIINAYGGLWADEIFDTVDEAVKFIKRNYPEADHSKFKLVQAVKTVSVYRQEGEPIFLPMPHC